MGYFREYHKGIEGKTGNQLGTLPWCRVRIRTQPARRFQLPPGATGIAYRSGGWLAPMFKMTSRNVNFLLFFVALTVFGSVIVLIETIPESTFELASESRLPKWITLPPGLTRADVSITMSYYSKPWGGSATFTLQDRKGQIRTKVDGKVKGLEPFRLKHPPQGFPPGYPAYEIVTVNGVTEIIEHRKPEPLFYITDDPAVWKELGVGPGGLADL